MPGRIRTAALSAMALASLALSSCGGLQPVDPALALRDGAAAMAQLKTVSANLTFTKGKITFQGYSLVSARAKVRMPADSDTIVTVRAQDLLIGLEVVISAGHVYLRPPLSDFTEIKGKNAADVPDVAKLFDVKTGLPAVIPEGQNPRYIGVDKIGDADSHKITATYSATQIAALLPQLKSSGDVVATIWIGGADHLIRKATLDGNFGDGGAASSVEVDMSGFNASVTIPSPSPTL